VLYHSYYVTNYLASGLALSVFQNYYDFIVAAGDLLYDPSRADVSRIDAFGVNTEVRFSSDAPFSPEATPGNLWIRIFRGQTGLTIHVINLLDQKDSIWNEFKAPILSQTTLAISIDAAAFSNQASIGSSANGSVFKLKPMEELGNRLQITVDICDAWTIVNIPLKTKTQ